MNREAWQKEFDKTGPDNPALNSCINCKFELTCGYSHLAMIKERTRFSYGPCVLGDKSDGHPFFEQREHIRRDKEND